MTGDSLEGSIFAALGEIRSSQVSHSETFNKVSTATRRCDRLVVVSEDHLHVASSGQRALIVVIIYLV